MQNLPIGNPSWPFGRWRVSYIKEVDRWRITTNLGLFVADVGPTLVARGLVEAFNAELDRREALAASRKSRGANEPDGIN